MATGYDFSTVTNTPTGSGYTFPSTTVKTSTPAVSAAVAPTPVAPSSPSLLSSIGSIGGDVIDGIKGVLSQFIGGATASAVQAQQQSPVQPSVKNFFETTNGQNGGTQALSIGAASLANTLKDTVSKAQAAYTAFTTPTSGTQKVAATGEALLGGLNALFSPISSVLAATSAVPGVGYIADGVNDIFAGLAGGASNVASNAVDNLVSNGIISQKTATTIKPLVSDTAGLIAQVLAGKAGDDVAPKIAEQTKIITHAIADQIQNLPTARGFVRNPFAFDPGSPEAKGEVGSLAVEKDPAKIAQTLRDMGAQGNIADAFAPKIAAETDPTKISDILQTAKGAQNLSDGGHLDVPELPEAAQTDWENNYAEQHGELQKEYSDAQAELKTAKAAERPALEQKVNQLSDKIGTLEDEFVQKWRAAAPEETPEAELQPAPADSSVEKETSNLRDAYEKGATYKDDVTDLKGKDALEQHMERIHAEMDIAQPGFRYQNSEGETQGAGSTFPQYIPEELRNSKLFGGVRDKLDNFEYPRKKNVRQRALMDAFYNTLDERTGVDTSRIRDRLKAQYDAKEDAAAQATGKGKAESASGRAARGEDTPERKAELEKIHNAIRRPAPDDRISTPGDIIQDLPPSEQGPLKTEINDVVRKPGAKAHLLDYLSTPEYVLERLGLGKEAKGLRDAFEGYMENKKTELARIQKLYDEVKDVPGNSSTIFDYLDGQEQAVRSLMTDKEYAVARDIREYLQDWAKRLKLPEDNQISHYITHLFEPGTTEAEKEGGAFEDPELAALMSQQVAGSVYDPFLERRTGAQNYKHDVWAALDAYVKRATRKEAMDPALEALKTASMTLDEQSYNYVMKLSHRINMRPTELEKLVDNLIKQSAIGHRFGDRPIAYLSNKMRSLFYRGTIGLNFGSAIRNLTQGVNTYAKLGEKYTTIGYAKLAYRLMSRNVGELYDNHILDEGFVQDKKVGVYKTALQKLDPVLYGVFETAEMINRGAAYFGAKSKAIAQGMSENDAIDYAKRMVRETQFTFGSIDTPVALNDDVVKTLTQLQTYNVKQIEFLARMVKNKEFAGLIRYGIGSYVALNTIGKLFGMTLGQLLPTVGIGGSPLGTLSSNIAGTFSSNAQNKTSAENGLKSQIWTLFPGGAQIHKTILGLEAYYSGKDVTATGRTRFNIPHNPGTLLQSALFGKSALPQAQEYYNNIGKKKTTSSASAYTF